MTNLLEETLGTLQQAGKTPADVRWVGGGSVWMTWDEFAQCANVEHDAGFGAVEVAQDLKVVGADWWLERHEYDDAESWEFKTLPLQPEMHVPRLKLTGGMSDVLAQLNDLFSAPVTVTATINQDG